MAYARFSGKLKTGAATRQLLSDRITGSTGLNFNPINPVYPVRKS
jgi:hypothetical protein